MTQSYDNDRAQKIVSTPHLKSDRISALDEARERLDKMTALFAYLDGDDANNGAGDDYREDFNAAAAGVVSHLRLLREMLVSDDAAEDES